MDIEIRNNEMKFFKDLKAGDVFRSYENTYIKINAPSRNSMTNAIVLPSFKTTHFADCTPVVLRKARLIVDD